MATLVAVVTALKQHWGGLEETLRFALQQAHGVPLDETLRQKLVGGRVFGTLVYPNTLAGFLVVALGPVLAWLWLQTRSRRLWIRWGGLGVAGGTILWCLWLTGSRGGLLAMAVMTVTGALLLARQNRHRWWALAATAALLALGLVAVGRRGTSSFSARLDYWRGAVAIARDNPWLGTGPGTFGSIYPKYKTATTEEAQLAHNGYLEMWCDSGAAAFVIFAAFWAIGWWQAVRLTRQRPGDPVALALAVALTGWIVHQGVDFDLHVPGVAVPAFLLLGMVCGLRLENSGPRTANRSWRVEGLLAVGLLIALAVWEGQMLVASQRSGVGDFQGAVRWASRNADYWSAAGLAAAQAGAPELAVIAFHQSVRLDWFRAAHHWRLAQAELSAHGLTGQVRRELRLAVELNPTHSSYRQALTETEEKLRQGASGLLEFVPAEAKPGRKLTDRGEWVTASRPTGEGIHAWNSNKSEPSSK